MRACAIGAFSFFAGGPVGERPSVGPSWFHDARPDHHGQWLAPSPGGRCRHSCSGRLLSSLTLARGLALLRWRRSDDRLVSPADFIPLLEETGLIVPVGRWVLAQALATTLHWRRTLWPGLRVAINVSAEEFRHRDFLKKASDLLEPFAACQPIDIELTESLLVTDVEQSTEVLQQLRNLGCKIDIDDFGTGYSSLNYLIKLPIDGIKIDRSFIAVLTESPETTALSSTIISLAHSLGISVVAEGVETEDQARLLHLLRCDFLQGFLLGRPMDAQAFAENVLVGGPINNTS